MRQAALVLIFLPLLACQAPNPGRIDTQPRTLSAAKTSLELIGEARDRGDIDGDTATLYRVYAVVDGAKLPDPYRGSLPLKDGTTVLRDARSRFENLRPEVREALKPYLFPEGER